MKVTIQTSFHSFWAGLIKNPGRLPGLPGVKKFNKDSRIILETESKFIDEHVVIINLVASAGALEVITGKEISAAHHIRQVVGEFVSSGEINFRTVGAACKTCRFLVGLRVG